MLGMGSFDNDELNERISTKNRRCQERTTPLLTHTHHDLPGIYPISQVMIRETPFEEIHNISLFISSPKSISSIYHLSSSKLLPMMHMPMRIPPHRFPHPPAPPITQIAHALPSHAHSFAPAIRLGAARSAQLARPRAPDAALEPAVGRACIAGFAARAGCGVLLLGVSVLRCSHGLDFFVLHGQGDWSCCRGGGGCGRGRGCGRGCRRGGRGVVATVLLGGRRVIRFLAGGVDDGILDLGGGGASVWLDDFLEGLGLGLRGLRGDRGGG